MRYKQDWDMAKKRLTAFWDRDILDRCCISVKVPGQAAQAMPQTDAERLRHWTDPEYIIRRNRAAMEHTYYGGEAFPCIFVNLGAAGHAGFFKGEKHYFGDSVWFFPSLTDIDALEFDENGFMYQKTLELARAFAEDSAVEKTMKYTMNFSDNCRQYADPAVSRCMKCGSKCSALLFCLYLG